jgi:Tfp pilus assembly protein PilN
MIKINLLPPEKRKAERTPPRFFAMVVVNVAALALIGVYLLFVWMEIRETEEKILSKQVELANLQKAVQEHDELEREFGQLQAKIREIDDLTKRDVEWWDAINALWDVIHQNAKVWIDDLKILDSAGALTEIKRADASTPLNPIYGLIIRCHVAGNDVSEMTKFRNALKNHPGLNRTLSVINLDVDWRVDDEQDAEAKHSIGFTVSLFGFPAASPPAPVPAAPPTGTPGLLQ